jgi:FkbM family methyltransferase
MSTALSTLPEPNLRLRALRRVIRLLPRGRSVAMRRLLPLTGDQRIVRGELFSGLSFRADLRQPIAKTLFFYGHYEQNVTSVLLRYLGEGQTAIDAGAHLGYWTLLMAAATGPAGAVYSFEPNPQTLAELEANVRLNDFSHVQTFSHALGAERGTHEFYFGSVERSDVASLIRTPAAAKSRTIVVDSVRLDDFCRERGIRRVDLLKMDIEGGEGYAIEGMREGIAEGLYRCVLLELHPQALVQLSIGPSDILDVFQSAGYRCYRIENYRRGVWERYSLRFDVRTLQPEDDGPWNERWPHYLLLAPGVPEPATKLAEGPGRPAQRATSAASDAHALTKAGRSETKP